MKLYSLSFAIGDELKDIFTVSVLRRYRSLTRYLPVPETWKVLVELSPGLSEFTNAGYSVPR